MNIKYGTFYCFIILFLLISYPGFCQDISNDECLDCHSDMELTKTTEDGKEDTLFVDLEKFSNSIHGEFSCIECHDNIEELPHDEELERPNCNMCHEDVEEEYLESIHGKSLQEGHSEAPYCWHCHTSHYVYPSDDSASTLFILNQPKVCAKCHSNAEIVKKYNIPIFKPCEVYKTSIHFKAALEDGCLHAAKCSDCHGAHDVQPSSHPTSLTNKFNIPGTCSACHDSINTVYMESVHGKGLLAGATDSPVCTDCHTEHAIKTHADPTSTVFTAVISKTTCPRCHEAEKIISKYRLNREAVDSYNDSYHGLANRSGSIVTANCASCHGVHNIKPSDDPVSLIHKDNLRETCGDCHPGITDKVAIGKVHIKPTPQSDKIIYYATWFYIFMIIGVIGGMIFHNGIDFLKKLKAKFKGHGEHTLIEEFSGREFERLSGNERTQHFILMSTFITLVITGFVLKFPEAWWAMPFTRWEGAFAVRGLLHRIAGGLMILLSIYHVYYIFMNKRGKKHIMAMLPVFKDLKDIIQMIQFNLGLAKEKPKFDYYNYIEKMEYWALIWGTFVMGATGFILWFENLAMKYFPKWVTDVSTVIHYYEAILATLAIIIWHFYYQFFDPHIYPMNTTCLTGKMSEKQMMEEHGLEYERLTENKF
ncbi:cytochrome c3 family protein [candidate division KSB1 bacterium]|nr:cytochrome c3 family protein [candidate division KSB1 bacterium]